MQRIDNRLVYSTTDIVGALECRHLAHLERAVVDGHLKRPMRADPVLDRIAQRGFEHEVRFLEELIGDDLTVVEIPRYETLPRAEQVMRGREATIEALRGGADVIYQAVLFEGRCLGYADFLRRVQQPSELGPWSYEVWDTKLCMDSVIPVTIVPSPHGPASAIARSAVLAAGAAAAGRSAAAVGGRLAGAGGLVRGGYLGALGGRLVLDGAPETRGPAQLTVDPLSDPGRERPRRATRAPLGCQDLQLRPRSRFPLSFLLIRNADGSYFLIWPPSEHDVGSGRAAARDLGRQPDLASGRREPLDTGCY